MSAVTASVATTPGPDRVPALKVTQGRVLLSEFTKFRSLRSTMWTLLAAVALMIGLGLLIAWDKAKSRAERAPLPAAAPVRHTAENPEPSARERSVRTGSL